jgi:hypothetical protein
MHESSPSSLSTSAELVGPALDRLRAAADAALESHVDEALLGDAACAVAREARARGVPPERLLVSIKAVWAESAAAHPGADRRAHAERLELAVRQCIRAYFE